MRKSIFIILMLCILCFAGCSTSDSAGSSYPSVTGETGSYNITSSTQTDSKVSLDDKEFAEEGPQDNSTPDRDVSTTTSEATGNQVTADSQRHPGTTETTSNQSKENHDSSEKKDTSKSSSSQTDTKEPPSETTVPETTVPTVEYAGKDDCTAVANAVAKYVNEYRSTKATYLPGLAQYAKYRSQQIISNFSHSTADQRAAATALEYGEYIDPSVYGGSGSPYYRANAREAIAKAGYVGTVDEVGQKLAQLARNSSDHWNYVGSSEYTYIAVGVTYESGMWYCAITVASQNTDEY